jgi:hypothetical protein
MERPVQYLGRDSLLHAWIARADYGCHQRRARPLGDRFYGTVTAYVQGPQAAKFRFTRALTVQLVRMLAGEFKPLLMQPRPEVGG